MYPGETRGLQKGGCYIKAGPPHIKGPGIDKFPTGGCMTPDLDLFSILRPPVIIYQLLSYSTTAMPVEKQTKISLPLKLLIETEIKRSNYNSPDPATKQEREIGQ